MKKLRIFERIAYFPYKQTAIKKNIRIILTIILPPFCIMGINTSLFESCNISSRGLGIHNSHFRNSANSLFT